MFLRHEKVKKKYAESSAYQKQNLLHQTALKQIDTTVITFQEIEKIIEQTLAELPGRCREVFVLSRIEGKKNQEIANELSISLKAVEAQITKALKTFRLTLKDYLPLVAFLLFINK